jgi:hypothetical protein
MVTKKEEMGSTYANVMVATDNATVAAQIQ